MAGGCAVRDVCVETLTSPRLLPCPTDGRRALRPGRSKQGELPATARDRASTSDEPDLYQRVGATGAVVGGTGVGTVALPCYERAARNKRE